MRDIQYLCIQYNRRWCMIKHYIEGADLDFVLNLPVSDFNIQPGECSRSKWLR